MKKPYTEINFTRLPIKVQEIFNEILEREGGEFVDHPNDHPTKWGIRKLSADAAGYTGRIEDITRDVAAQIWVSLFWYGPNIHVLANESILIAETVLDTAGPAGYPEAIKQLQQALTSFNLIHDGYRIYGNDLAMDGLIGPLTIKQLRAYLKHRKNQEGEAKLATRLNCLQDAHYTRLAVQVPKKRSFSFGWTSTRVYADLMHIADSQTMFS